MKTLVKIRVLCALKIGPAVFMMELKVVIVGRVKVEPRRSWHDAASQGSQIVDAVHLVTGLEQASYKPPANKARASGHQNFFHGFFAIIIDFLAANRVTSDLSFAR